MLLRLRDRRALWPSHKDRYGDSKRHSGSFMRRRNARNSGSRRIGLNAGSQEASATKPFRATRARSSDATAALASPRAA